jgi:hypothetical protein
VIDQRVIPMLSYEDAGRAADWISKAFGFEEAERFEHEGTGLHPRNAGARNGRQPLRLSGWLDRSDLLLLGLPRDGELGTHVFRAMGRNADLRCVECDREFRDDERFAPT